MFELGGGLLLNLYPRADLAKDAAIPVGPPQSGAGATVTPAQDRPWGIYSGYFRDLKATFGKSSGRRTAFPKRAAEASRASSSTRAP